MNVHPIRDTFSRKVHVPGELSEVEEWRLVPMSSTQAKLIEEHGLWLMKQGANEKAARFLAIYLAWKWARPS